MPTTRMMNIATRSVARNVSGNKPANLKKALVSFVQQKERSAALCTKIFEETPFDDVAARVYDSAQTSAVPAKYSAPPAQTVNMDTFLMFPETEDPMVAFVAASVDMQQRQADLLSASVRSAETQRKEMQEMMRCSIKLAEEYQNRHTNVFRSQMKARRADELEAFRVFGEQQRKYVKASLDDHSKAEKNRLQAFRKTHEEANKKKIQSQASKFTTSINRVTDTLNEHQGGINALLKSLKQQQDVSRALKTTIDHKISPAMSTNKNETIDAITAIGTKLRHETSKGVNAVVKAVSHANRSQVEGMRNALQEHGKSQKKMIEVTFNDQQKTQIKGLSAAVMNQKQKQAAQLNQLRSALEARRQAMSLPTPTKSGNASFIFPASLSRGLKDSRNSSPMRGTSASSLNSN